MIRSLILATVLATTVAAPGAGADTLRCAVFKARLDEAMRAASSLDGSSLAYTLVRSGGSFTRYAWSGVPGLRGMLTCGQNDAFADFYMMIDPATRPSSAVPADISRFTDLGAASICALSTGVPETCRAMIATMTEDGIDQYEDDLAHHDEQPRNLQDYDFAKHLDAVFSVTPDAMSWAIGPGLYSTVPLERPPLVPVDRDRDDAKTD